MPVCLGFNHTISEVRSGRRWDPSSFGTSSWHKLCAHVDPLFRSLLQRGVEGGPTGAGGSRVRGHRWPCVPGLPPGTSCRRGSRGSDRAGRLLEEWCGHLGGPCRATGHHGGAAPPPGQEKGRLFQNKQACDIMQTFSSAHSILGCNIIS